MLALAARSLIRFSALLVLASLPAWTPAFARFEPTTCHNSFTQQQEVEEGAKVAAKVYQQMPVLPESDPVSQYVQHIGQRLLAAAPLTPGLKQQWPFSFHVVASSEINAFALPGGATFVNLGAVQAAETEAQLAGVMAHEMSHVLLRHSTCNMVQQQHKSILYSLGEIGSSIFLGNGAVGSLASLGLGMGEKLDFLHMSRGDEKQADLLGVNIMDRAGYDPRGLAQFFEIIQSKYGSGGSQFLSDHPNPGNRTQYVDAEIKTLPPRTADTTINTPEYRKIHAIAMAEKTFTARQIADGAWKRVGGYIAGPGRAAVGGSPTPGDRTAANPVEAETHPSPGPNLQPLSPAQLGLSDPMTRYQAARWSMAAPANWTRTVDQPAPVSTTSSPAASPVYDSNGQATVSQPTPAPSRSVLLAPAGASGSFGIAYGAIVSIAQVGGNGVQNQAQLQDATTQLVQSLASNQPGLSEAGAPVAIQVAGQPAYAVDLRGPSPVGQSRRNDTEYDRMITIARPDGDVSTIIFVAPENQYSILKPLFDRMLASFQPQ